MRVSVSLLETACAWRLCRYAGRPPLATERLSLLPDGRLFYRLKRRRRDGTTHVIYEPLELMERLAALVHPPRFNITRYYGVLAPAATFRPRVIPEAEASTPPPHPGCQSAVEAPLPELPQIVDVVKPGTTIWRFTTKQPGDTWSRPDFDDAVWAQAPGGFGTRGTPNTDVKTAWDTADIWLRAEINLPEGNYNELQLSVYHDEDAEVYINGQQAARLAGYTTDYELVPVGVRAILKPGKNLFAVHCHQTAGGQFIDLGIVDIRPVK
jgi:hypothetical protein